MIFISVGTHPQPMSRLLNEVRRLVERKLLTGEIIIQTGYTSFTHPKMKCIPFLSIEEFETHMKNAQLVITHAGEGNIGTALKFGKPLVVIPRRSSYNEHTNDHQMELAKAVEENGLGEVVYEINHLEDAIQRVQKIPKKQLSGFIPQILYEIAQQHGIKPKKPFSSLGKKSIPKTASIIVATLNGGQPLIHAVNGMMQQEFNGKYEIIVVDDGSFDHQTPELLRKNFGKNPKVKLIFLPRSGVCKARNAGIRNAQYEIVINLDHDCIPEKDWLQNMVNGFHSPKIGIVSAYGHFGGTSTGFRRDLLNHAQGYDEDYFYYREDTDLSFKLMDLGFSYERVNNAHYREDRTLIKPRGITGLMKYTWTRLRYHMNDVLLHKKHPTPLCENFLHVKFGMFVNPKEDFKVVTGLWENQDKKPELSSPRGITFFQNSNFLTYFFTILMGLVYVIGIKLARLAGSIKHGHILI